MADQIEDSGGLGTGGGGDAGKPEPASDSSSTQSKGDRGDTTSSGNDGDGEQKKSPHRQPLSVLDFQTWMPAEDEVDAPFELTPRPNALHVIKIWDPRQSKSSIRHLFDDSPDAHECFRVIDASYLADRVTRVTPSSYARQGVVETVNAHPLATLDGVTHVIIDGSTSSYLPVRLPSSDIALTKCEGFLEARNIKVTMLIKPEALKGREDILRKLNRLSEPDVLPWLRWICSSLLRLDEVTELEKAWGEIDGREEFATALRGGDADEIRTIANGWSNRSEPIDHTLVKAEALLESHLRDQDDPSVWGAACAAAFLPNLSERAFDRFANAFARANELTHPPYDRQRRPIAPVIRIDGRIRRNLTIVRRGKSGESRVTFASGKRFAERIRDDFREYYAPEHEKMFKAATCSGAFFNLGSKVIGTYAQALADLMIDRADANLDIFAMDAAYRLMEALDSDTAADHLPSKAERIKELGELALGLSNAAAKTAWREVNRADDPLGIVVVVRLVAALKKLAITTGNRIYVQISLLQSHLIWDRLCETSAGELRLDDAMSLLNAAQREMWEEGWIALLSRIGGDELGLIATQQVLTEQQLDGLIEVIDQWQLRWSNSKTSLLARSLIARLVEARLQMVEKGLDNNTPVKVSDSSAKALLRFVYDEDGEDPFSDERKIAKRYFRKSWPVLWQYVAPPFSRMKSDKRWVEWSSITNIHIPLRMFAGYDRVRETAWSRTNEVLKQYIYRAENPPLTYDQIYPVLRMNAPLLVLAWAALPKPKSGTEQENGESQPVIDLPDDIGEIIKKREDWERFAEGYMRIREVSMMMLDVARDARKELAKKVDIAECEPVAKQRHAALSALYEKLEAARARALA